MSGSLDRSARARPAGASHLLWPGWVGSQRMSASQTVTRGVFLLVGLGIAAGIYSVAVWFLTLCYQVEVIGPLLCRRLLDVVLVVLLSVLLLSNIVTALSALFLSDDLELLVPAPVPPRAFFTARFAEQLLHSSWMVLAFGLPVLLAFARVAGGAKTYLAIALTLPPLLVIPAALGAALVLLLVSLFPASRVRSLVVGLMFITFLVLYVALRLVEPERLVNPDGFASIVYMLTSLSSPTASLLPSAWVTTVIAATFREAAAADDWPLPLAALWTGALAAHAGASLVFRRLYGAGFSHSQEGKHVARFARLWARLRGRPFPADGAIRAPGALAPAVDWIRCVGWLAPRGAHREMVIKDAKLLLRDASQWSQLVLLLALVFVYLYNFRHFRQIGEAGLVGDLALYLLGMALSGFVTTAVSVRFAFPLVSLEGQILWLLRSSPLQPRQILVAKLLATLPPLIIVAEVMSIASSFILGVSPSLVVLGASVAACTAVAVASLSTGIGALLPDYRADSAAKVAASFGGLVCMSVAMVVALLLVGFALYPAWTLHHAEHARAHYAHHIATWRVVAVIGSIVGGLIVTGLSVVVPLHLGARAFGRHEP